MPTAGSIYYFASKQEENAQPAVVLIHGAGGTHLHWPYNLRRLNNHRVFAPDLPGHGKSEGIGEQSIEKYAQAIVDWLDEIGVTKATFVGHSMGGAIVQSLAINYPNYVHSLVLIGTGSVLQVNHDLLEKLSSPTTSPAALDLIVKWSFSKRTDPKIMKQGRNQMDDIRSSVIYGDYIACSKFNVTERLPEIMPPTLILCGDVDKMTPTHFSKHLHEKIPNSSITLIPDGGHMVMIEQPDIVAHEINRFLTRS